MLTIIEFSHILYNFSVFITISKAGEKRTIDFSPNRMPTTKTLFSTQQVTETGFIQTCLLYPKQSAHPDTLHHLPFLSEIAPQKKPNKFCALSGDSSNPDQPGDYCQTVYTKIKHSNLLKVVSPTQTCLYLSSSFHSGQVIFKERY